MKRIITIFFIIATIFLAVEYGNLPVFANYKPSLTWQKNDNDYILTWQKLPYPAYYEIEVLVSRPNNDRQAMPDNQRIAKYKTWENSFVISQNYPFRTYWRVSAHGLFKNPLGKYSNNLNLTKVMGRTAKDVTKMKPIATSFFSDTYPASTKPMLTWTVVPGAVYYEIEFLNAPPENPNSIFLSDHRIFVSREVFTNGYNADLSWYTGSRIFWRVRALDYDGNPLGVFSDANTIVINRNISTLIKPVINTVFNVNGISTPLYPVYSWVPILGATKYEVEVTNEPPENPNGTEPSIYRVWSKHTTGSDCYDEEPRTIPGKYFWRVRGLDENDNPVGAFSDTGEFIIDLSAGNYSATFGDSITHGGGSLSYSPADWEYDFQTYLNFPTVNLGKSGDTSATMVDRFDNDVLPFKPKYLIIMGGTNSLRGGTPASDVIRELSIIRNKCMMHGIRPIFLTLPPINPSAINRAFQEETATDWKLEFATVNNFIRQQRYYIDLAPYFTDKNGELPSYYAIDGLHLDIEGKKLMAQLINANWTKLTH